MSLLKQAGKYQITSPASRRWKTALIPSKSDERGGSSSSVIRKNTWSVRKPFLKGTDSKEKPQNSTRQRWEGEKNKLGGDGGHFVMGGVQEKKKKKKSEDSSIFLHYLGKKFRGTTFESGRERGGVPIDVKIVLSERAAAGAIGGKRRYRTLGCRSLQKT